MSDGKWGKTGNFCRTDWKRPEMGGQSEGLRKTLNVRKVQSQIVF